MAMHSTLVNSRPRHGRDTAGAGTAVLGSEASVGIGVDCGPGSGRKGDRDDETTAVGASRRPGSAKGAPQGRRACRRATSVPPGRSEGADSPLGGYRA